MSDPMFVMSMYVNKEELYKAKATYYMEKSERVSEEVFDCHNPHSGEECNCNICEDVREHDRE